MKKLSLLVVFALILAFLCSFALADDLSNKSSGDLLQLREQIDAELAKRGDNELLILPAGEYVVGKDIAEGQYLVHFIKINVSGLTIKAHKTGASSDDPDYEAFPMIFINNTQGDASITLEVGMTINVDIIGAGYATIEKTKGLFMD